MQPHRMLAIALPIPLLVTAAFLIATLIVSSVSSSPLRVVPLGSCNRWRRRP
jgi:hypothetical protein